MKSEPFFHGADSQRGSLPASLSLNRRERVLAQDGAESLTPLAFLPIVQAKLALSYQRSAHRERVV
jgi:hypothetical protein